jgi:DNA-binding MarR family transcriptional regulator
MSTRRPPTPAELDAFYEALQALLRVYQFRDRDRPCYADLTPHDCYALEAVERPGELPVSRLAAELGLHKSNASRIAASLEQRGYVARRPAAGDGRSVLLRLTPLGRARHAAVRRRVQQAQRRILRDHPARVRAAFCTLLVELAREASRRFGGEGRRTC